jgi:hypothetical protein
MVCAVNLPPATAHRIDLELQLDLMTSISLRKGVRRFAGDTVSGGKSRAKDATLQMAGDFDGGMDGDHQPAGGLCVKP